MRHEEKQRYNKKSRKIPWIKNYKKKKRKNNNNLWSKDKRPTVPQNYTCMRSIEAKKREN